MTNEIYRDSSIYYDPTNNLINYITWDNGYSTESSTIFDDGWFAYVLIDMRIVL